MASIIAKTDALVLRTEPYANTSQVVIWLTRDGMRLATLVKGAQRPKSQFLGQYDAFYTCELLYYDKNREGLHIARECAPLIKRDRLRTDWKACAIASHISALLQRTTADANAQPALFDLASHALNTLQDKGGRRETLYWFEMQLLGTLGLAPRMDACAICGKRSPQDGRQKRFSVQAGGLVCRSCVSRQQAPTDPLTPDIVTLLHRWQMDTSGRLTYATRCTPKQHLVFRHIIGRLLVYHLEITSRSRAITTSLLANE